MDRGTRKALVHGVAQSQTRLNQLITRHYYSQLLYYCGLFIFSFFALHLFLVSFLVCFSLPSKSESFLYTLQPLFCHLLDVCREATWPPKLPVLRKGPYPLTILPKITYCYWHLVWFCLFVPCLLSSDTMLVTWGQGLGLFCSLVYFLCPELCLACDRYSVNICWMN